MSQHPSDPVMERAAWRLSRHTGIVAFFVVALAVTAGLRAWNVAHVAATVQTRQEAVVAEALAYIERDFNEIQGDLLARARALAEAPGVAEALRAHNQGDRAAGTEALIGHLAALRLPDRWSVELYDPAFAQVAWNGFSIAFDEDPPVRRPLESLQTAIAHDGDWRQALVVWYPVRDGVRTLGAVRMMRLLLARTPVRNDYLRDYRIATDWQRSTRLTVAAQFDRPFSDETPGRGQARLLQGADGTLLGRVVVEAPPVEGLVETTRTRYDDVLAFWATLLLFWGIAAVWTWSRKEDAAVPARRPLLRAGGRLALVAAAWWGARYALLVLDVPARWQRGKAPFSPLFDPTHLASTFGGGLMRSAGDLLITAIFALLFAFALLDFAGRLRRQPVPASEAVADGGSLAWPFRWLASLTATVLAALGLILVLALVARHAVLDSTLDYFAREGLLPQDLVLVIFAALLLFTLTVVVLVVVLMWMTMRHLRRPLPARRPSWKVGLAIAAAVGVPVVFYAGFGLHRVAPWYAAVAVLIVGLGLGAVGFARQGNGLRLLTLRNVLLTVFVMSLLLYPMFYSGLDTQRRMRMHDAADLFNEGHQDPGVVFAIAQVLEEARAEPLARQALTAPDGVRRASLDSLATVLLRNSRLASLGAYDVSLVFIDAAGTPAGRYDVSDETLSRLVLDQYDAGQFDILQQMYAERNTPGPMVEPVTGRRESSRFQHEGIVPLDGGDGAAPVGWIMARAEPHAPWYEDSAPFLRVLLPSVYGNLYANLSLAEFRGGALLRSLGRDFGRYRLDEAVRRDLTTRREGWHNERVEARRYLTYYRRESAESSPDPILAPVEQMVVAVRVPVITPFDHLYYLLRLTVAGLLAGTPFYLVGLFLRRRAGWLPAPRVRFLDKVLNAFLVVGIVAVTAVGFLGVSVVTGENERAVQSWLRQHLQRVEETLALEARGSEMPYRVLQRIQIDSLAARVGLDLNLYQDARLTAASRPQLIRERLIDERLPVAAYQALYLDGFEFTHVEERLGSFAYTAGYRALLDEQRRPRYVIALPTLPEQERIEEERARTVAYLFGALLLLVVVVMGTAALLANALARPIARLRVGLEDVAQGRFERTLPVNTRDEIGELVQTFNLMQGQLAESRRKLTQQERQLAWREMARQVAHEIKNPLTPMKLSVQHLRRAFLDVEEPLGGGDPARLGRFAGLFERITNTLVEQIDTLARIANEFSSFARMPTRIPERLDLNAVIREAVSLMQAEADAEIELDLYPEPLVLEADREELRRIYINLIKNALQAMPDDRRGRVMVTTTRAEGVNGQPGRAYSAVADTGLGIPADLRDKIFEPNFSTKTSGTGLGLAIARESIEELSGEIDFETEEGVGTTFRIRLPLVE